MSDTPTPRVVKIWQENDRTLGIEWTHGRRAAYDVVTLRRACTCAQCRDENTGAALLEPGMVSESVRPTRVSSVGRYALSIAFDDGHSTGIYRFRSLFAAGQDL